MKSGIAVALALAVFFSAVAVPLMINDSSDATVYTEATVKGVIVESGDSGPVAVKGVDVTIKQGTTTSATFTTLADGVFSINFTDLDTTVPLEITVSKDGFSVFYYPSCMNENELNHKLEIDLSSVDHSTVSGKEVFTITAATDLSHGIVISDTRVPAAFTVTKGSEGTIFDAQITLTNGTTTYTGRTAYDGTCTIKNVLIGNYDLRVTCDGYEQYNGNVNISKNTGQLSVVMTQKEMPTYLGMTLYHILMIFGIAISLVLVIIAYVLCTRTWKGVDSTE